MKFIRKCPVFLLLVSTGLLFTIIGIGGRNTIYSQQDHDLLREPFLSLVFSGLNEKHYPWQIFDVSSETFGEDNLQASLIGGDGAVETDSAVETGSAVEADGTVETGSAGEESPQDAVMPASSAAPVTAREPVLTATPQPSFEPFERLDPLRESTREEYLNHISADIYGDAGVLRAASYAFAQVDESYFDDALFIGDSRTVGLKNYTDLSDHADFYCETSLTIYNVLEENFKGKGTIPDALAQKDYGKIYIMVGINELGRGTTEDFMGAYTGVVDTLHELEPDALIFIQGIMRVSGSKNNSDAIFNNSNINARNNAIATLADNQTFFYIDVNEAVCDENGDLNSDYTTDQIHLLGVYDDLWKQFLLAHGVTGE